MEELLTKANKLKSQIESAFEQIKVNDLTLELDKLRNKSLQQDFWTDNKKAQNTMKQISKIEESIKPWEQALSETTELIELIKLNDKSLLSEMTKQLNAIGKKIDKEAETLKYSGEYDDHDVILSIYSGAGGTDAQDWAEMLLRMYLRWCEKNNYKVKVDDESKGEGAGIKSATLEIEGRYAYARLKSENGVHRLVRLSPYNADNLRQTSFAKVEVMPKIDKPEEIVIEDEDIKVDVYRSGGHGGQSVNTTDSAVRITHLPTGITVAIQNERSQLQNKETALTILRSRLAKLQLEQHITTLKELKGPNVSAEWGNQIRSYVLHPYKQVKDLRTNYESSDPDSVLDGNLNEFIEAYLKS